MGRVKTLVPLENPVRSQSLPQQARPTKNHEEPPLLKLKLSPILGLSVHQTLVKIQCLHIQLVLVSWKPAHFSEDSSQVPNHLLGSSVPEDHGHSAPQEVLHKCVQVRSPTPLVSGDSDLDKSDKSIELPMKLASLKKQLRSKKKQVQKAQKTTKIEQLHYQIVTTDKQLAHLWQQRAVQNSVTRKGCSL